MTSSLPPGVSAFDVSAWFHVGETPSGQKIVVLSTLYIQQITNIMKYQLIRMRRLKVDDYRLHYLNDLFGIKLIFYNLSRIQTF